jgi:hypothetical protein
MTVTDFTFAPATREQVKARVALQGPAGSGKTKSALLLAETLAAGGTIGLIDTERGSARRYAPVPGRPDLGGHHFLHLPMDSYDPRDLQKAVQSAAAAGVDCLIVDSWSHFYAGKGGLLELVDGFGKKSGSAGTFGGWKEATPIEQETLDTLLRFPGHLICTLRTKNDYSLDGGKVTHHGVKVIQREGTEYEFDIIGSMVDGTVTFTKTRCPALTGAVYRHPGADVAEVILEWLGEGVGPQDIMTELTAPELTAEQARELFKRARDWRLLEHLVQDPGTGTTMTLRQLLIEYGESLKPKAVPAPAPAATETTPATVRRDFLAEARAARDAATVRRIYDDAADAGADQADRALIAQIGRALEQAAPAAAGGPEPATAPQMRRIHAALGGWGITDRPERLGVLGALIGRAISTANELTKDDAGTVIDLLDAAQAQPDPGQYLRSLAVGVAQSAA